MFEKSIKTCVPNILSISSLLQVARMPRLRQREEAEREEVRVAGLGSSGWSLGRSRGAGRTRGWINGLGRRAGKLWVISGEVQGGRSRARAVGSMVWGGGLGSSG